MARPAAPTELGGSKLLFGMYDLAGANAAAIMHAVGVKTINGEVVGFLGVATHKDGATFAASDPTALVAGYDGTLVRKLLVDTSGRALIGGELVDNAAFTDGTTRVVPAGFIFDEVAGTALAENDVAAARIDSKRSAIAVIEDATTRGQRAKVSTAGALTVESRPLVTRIAVTPTLAGGGAYTAKDAVGTLLTFTNAAQAVGGTGIVTGVQIADKAQQLQPLDLVLFDRSVTTPTDNAVFDPTDTETEQIVGVIPIIAGDYSDFFDNSVAHRAVNLPFKLQAAVSSLFGVLVARGTPTYAAADLVVTLTVQQL